MASQPNNDMTALNGLFKIVYADKIKELIPDGVKLLKKVEFVPQAERQGESYRQSITLGMEHGFTYGGNTGTAFSLNGSIAGNTIFAEVKGHELMLESTVSLAAISRSANKDGAFVQATKHVVKNMMMSMYKRLEVQMLYGQMGIAKVDSVSGTSFVVTAAEWAPGIWNGAENMKIEFRGGATLRGTASVTTVNSDTKTITVDIMPVGVIATDDVYHAGAYGKEFAGVHKILTATSSLFSIDPTNYNLWKGNTLATSGALSFDTIKKAISLAVNKGLEGDVLALVSTKAWDELLSDVAALRRYDQSYDSSTAEYGHEAIKFHSQNGSVEIVPSIHVKEGYSYILSLEEFKRVGSSDVTFNRPGQEGQFIIDLPTNSGYGLRLYTDQALFCEAPGRGTLIAGIS